MLLKFTKKVLIVFCIERMYWSILLADAQKQERIEQMIADINKYKKLDKELTSLRQKHNEMEKNFTGKINEIVSQRDELQSQCDQFKGKVQEHEQLQIKYEQINSIRQ